MSIDVSFPKRGTRVLKERDTNSEISRTRGRPKRTLLNAAALAGRCHRSRVCASPDLAPFISVAWTLRWDLGDATYLQRVLPDPCVQIVVEKDGVHVVGIATGPFSVTLTGSRFVLGLKFRPGGFYPFIRQPVSRLTNRTVRLAEVFPDVDERPLQDLAAAANGEAVMRLLESILRKAAPELDAHVQDVYLISDRIAADATMLTVERAARAFGVSRRSFQRLFRRYVGIGPKWIIRRCRLQEAAARLEDGDVHRWTELALRLGYADQAHFINDFRRFVGRSPANYARAVVQNGANAPLDKGSS